MGKQTEITDDKVPMLPLMALRDVVVLPNYTRHLFVGRKQSLIALNQAIKTDSRIVFVTQRNEGTESPQRSDLFEIGCLAKVLDVDETDGGTKKVVVLGKQRIRIQKIITTKEKLQCCSFTELIENDFPTKHEQLYKRLKKLIIEQIRPKVSDLFPPLPKELKLFGRVIDQLAGSLELPVSMQQQVIEELSVNKRSELLLKFFQRESDISHIEDELGKQLREVNRDHRQDYLKERVADIQSALGDSGGQGDVDQLRKKVKEAGMSEEAYTKCITEINRLATMSPMSPETSVIRNYVDVLLSLPWKERSEVNYDLINARKVLDADHQGLEKVKDRIIEYLAVQKQVGNNRGSVLCLLGPPGVGKTSLGQSIAKATGRNFVRLALGGVNDEATIRGHRRTYVASMPGRILRAMAESKVTNPVFMLDEIEKLASHKFSDPMAALLEVIDPEQNSQFVDHYAEVEFDLSEVMFIATANTTENMYPAILDRLEVLELPGYTDREKLAIAKQHLVPKILDKSGLKPSDLRFSDPVITSIVRDYTKEAGVRNLERAIAKVARKVVLKTEMKKNKKRVATKLTKTNLEDYLGPPLSFHVLKRRDSIGIVNGLAVIGDWEGIVHQIDSIRLPGENGLVKTGNLMQNIEQSIDTACAILRASPEQFGLEKDFLDSHQIHIHYPNIDIKHDGNSNGLALFTLLVSVLNDIPVRMDTAVTGAINLRGEACVIGGLREKLIGAWRERIKRVIIPHIQAREVADVPIDIANELEIIPVKDVHELLSNMLIRMPKPIKAKKSVALSPKQQRTTSSTH